MRGLPAAGAPSCMMTSTASAFAPSRSETETTPPRRANARTSLADSRRAERTTSTPTFSMRSTYSLRATRTTVLSAPRCFASSASMRLSLSSSVRQTTTSASATPSSSRRSMSVPSPQMAMPWSSFSAMSWQRSWSFSTTLTSTSWPSRRLASARPVRPAPMTMTRWMRLASRWTKFWLNCSMADGMPMK